MMMRKALSPLRCNDLLGGDPRKHAKRFKFPNHPSITDDQLRRNHAMQPQTQRGAAQPNSHIAAFETQEPTHASFVKRN
jgi:hypothetical protein